MNNTPDIFVQADRLNQINEYRHGLCRLFREAIAEAANQKCTMAVHYDFYVRALFFQRLFTFKGQDFIWSEQYRRELTDWLQLNIPLNGRFAPTGIYSDGESVLSVH